MTLKRNNKASIFKNFGSHRRKKFDVPVVAKVAGTQKKEDNRQLSVTDVIQPDYANRFLVNIPSSSRCQTYINRDIYKRIKNFLPVIASDTSISGYINNILNHHLEQYGDEINDLYDKNYRRPF